jgi:hypothetical protein
VFGAWCNSGTVGLGNVPPKSPPAGPEGLPPPPPEPIGGHTKVAISSSLSRTHE